MKKNAAFSIMFLKKNTVQKSKGGTTTTTPVVVAGVSTTKQRQGQGEGRTTNSCCPRNHAADPTICSTDDGLPPRSPRPSALTATKIDDEGRGGEIIVRDNPCWGSPTQCSLRHLLTSTVLQQHDDNKQKDRLILYEDASFVAINKPPDLRMDGDYEATVLKLLAYWYPPPSLLRLMPPSNDDNASPTIKSGKNGDVEQPGEQEKGEDDLDDATAEASSSNKKKDEESLLQRVVATIQRHGDVDGLLRPCHQLDYATSGVLLCARSRNAANHVRLALEERRVSKTYLALLHGHLKIPKATTTTTATTTTKTVGDDCSWPPVWLNVVSSSSSAAAASSSPLDDLRRRLQVQEDTYRRARLKEGQNKSHTFVGYRPASSLFQQWKHALQENEQQRQQQQQEPETDQQQQQHQRQPRPKKSKWSAQKNNSSNNANINKKQQLLTDDEWTLVWNELRLNDDKDDTMSKLVKTGAASLNWKQVREQQQDFRFERAATKYNEILLNNRQKQQQEKGAEEIQEDDATLPVVFCMPGDKDDTFYICAPLAQHADEFKMRLPANTPYVVPGHLKVGGGKDYCASLDFKPCLTKCTIKRHCHVAVPVNGRDNNQRASNNNNDNNKSVEDERHCLYPVTKVEFSLMTGRRHQLRVHSALIGHSIVGDETYQDNVVPKNLSDRMCLHSHSLEVPLLPLLDNNSCSRSTISKNNDKSDAGTDQNILRVLAPDPFVETEDGCIVINML
jgi:23S rRNA-/tRNA-specific pseudouridylate synthase